MKRLAVVLLVLATLLGGCKGQDARNDPNPEGVATPETDPAMKQSRQMQTNSTPPPGTQQQTAPGMSEMQKSMGGQAGSGPR